MIKKHTYLQPSLNIQLFSLRSKQKNPTRKQISAERRIIFLCKWRTHNLSSLEKFTGYQHNFDHSTMHRNSYKWSTIQEILLAYSKFSHWAYGMHFRHTDKLQGIRHKTYTGMGDTERRYCAVKSIPIHKGWSSQRMEAPLSLTFMEAWDIFNSASH